MQVALSTDRLFAEATVGAGKAITLLAPLTDAVAHTVNGAAITGLGFFRQAAIVLTLTDAKAAAADTLSVYVDTSYDGGLTWVNAGRFTTILGNGADAIIRQMVLDPGGNPGATDLDVTSECASGVVRPTLFGDALRARYVIVDGGAHGQSFSVGVSAYVKAWGWCTGRGGGQ